MRDPSLPLQKAIFDALRAALPETVGVYDDVPLDQFGKITAKFPFVAIGEDQMVSESDQCHDPTTAYATVHVWSRGVGRVEAKTLMTAVCLALDVKLAVEGFNTLGAAVVDGPRDVGSADVLTKHRAATFRYRLDPIPA